MTCRSIEKYTDEQVEHLLADEEVKEFFHELAMARMAGKKANPKEVDVDGVLEGICSGTSRG